MRGEDISLEKGQRDLAQE